jgi:hypothetical protein
MGKLDPQALQMVLDAYCLPDTKPLASHYVANRTKNEKRQVYHLFSVQEVEGEQRTELVIYLLVEGHLIRA